MTEGELVTTTELARSSGVSRATAYRWIKAAEETFGPSLVARVGRRYRIHPSVLGLVGRSGSAPAQKFLSLIDVARALDALAERLDAFETKLAAFMSLS